MRRPGSHSVDQWMWRKKLPLECARIGISNRRKHWHRRQQREGSHNFVADNATHDVETYHARIKDKLGIKDAAELYTRATGQL